MRTLVAGRDVGEAVRHLCAAVSGSACHKISMRGNSTTGIVAAVRARTIMDGPLGVGVILGRPIGPYELKDWQERHLIQRVFVGRHIWFRVAGQSPSSQARNVLIWQAQGRCAVMTLQTQHRLFEAQLRQASPLLNSHGLFHRGRGWMFQPLVHRASGFHDPPSLCGRRLSIYILHLQNNIDSNIT